jgi:hypothetical protein
VLCWLQIFDYVDSSPLLRQNTYIMLTSDNGENAHSGTASQLHHSNQICPSTVCVWSVLHAIGACAVFVLFACTHECMHARKHAGAGSVGGLWMFTVCCACKCCSFPQTQQQDLNCLCACTPVNKGMLASCCC